MLTKSKGKYCVPKMSGNWVGTNEHIFLWLREIKCLKCLRSRKQIKTPDENINYAMTFSVNQNLKKLLETNERKHTSRKRPCTCETRFFR